MNTIIRFDIVIVAHSKDKDTLKICIERIKKHIKNYKNIYLISKENFLPNESIKWVNEKLFPFTKKDISDILSNACPPYRHGWYYQQLLKLYIYRIVEIEKYYLVIDADVIILNDFDLFDKTGKPYFTTGDEYNSPYFDHMKLLLPNSEKMSKFSGISHHMMFDKQILQEIFATTENAHKAYVGAMTSNKLNLNMIALKKSAELMRTGAITLEKIPFWKNFLECVVRCIKGNNYKSLSIASEYEIYFNYVLKYHYSKYICRNIKWKDIEELNLEEYKNDYYKYVVYHDYKHNNELEYLIE